MTWKTLAAIALGLGLALAAGCDKKNDKGGDKGGGKDGHEHGNGPHGGVVFDFGGGAYHGEFKPNHKEKSATVWILGADEKSLTPVKADRLRLVVSNTTPKIEIDLTPID